MKAHILSTTAAALVLLAACSSLPPRELLDARLAYQNANAGPAAELAPAELHKAEQALNVAEAAFDHDPSGYRTLDLAYVAQRKAQLANAVGVMAASTARKDGSNAQFVDTQTTLLARSKQDVSDANARADEATNANARAKTNQAQLNASQREQQQALAAQNQQSLADSEARTALARAELAKLAAVREESRGLIITLSGSILFASGQSVLLASAQSKLDQVSKTLLSVRERNLTVEGHTDSQGSSASNQRLSQQRAQSVRDYMVAEGYPEERIRAQGMGEEHAIADNGSAEGRANNRRVEIVIERETAQP